MPSSAVKSPGDYFDSVSVQLYSVHRSIKRHLEILDELFGRDRRTPDQSLVFSLEKALSAPSLALATRCPTSQSGILRARFHALLGHLGRDADVRHSSAERLRGLLGAGAIGREFSCKFLRLARVGCRIDEDAGTLGAGVAQVDNRRREILGKRKLQPAIGQSGIARWPFSGMRLAEAA